MGYNKIYEAGSIKNSQQVAESAARAAAVADELVASKNGPTYTAVAVKAGDNNDVLNQQPSSSTQTSSSNNEGVLDSVQKTSKDAMHKGWQATTNAADATKTKLNEGKNVVADEAHSTGEYMKEKAVQGKDMAKHAAATVQEKASSGIKTVKDKASEITGYVEEKVLGHNEPSIDKFQETRNALEHIEHLAEQRNSMAAPPSIPDTSHDMSPLEAVDQLAGDATNNKQHTTGHAIHQTTDVMDKAGKKAHDMTDNVKSAVGGAVDNTRNMVADGVETVQDKAAETREAVMGSDDNPGLTGKARSTVDNTKASTEQGLNNLSNNVAGAIGGVQETTGSFIGNLWHGIANAANSTADAVWNKTGDAYEATAKTASDVKDATKTNAQSMATNLSNAADTADNKISEVMNSDTKGDSNANVGHGDNGLRKEVVVEKKYEPQSGAGLTGEVPSIAVTKKKEVTIERL